MIDWISNPFPPDIHNIINPKPLELESWKFERMFTPHHVSRVPCHLSPVTCHMSPVTCQIIIIIIIIFLFFFYLNKKKNKKKLYDMWQVIGDRWQVTCDVWHLTRARYGKGNLLSKFRLSTSSYRLGMKVYWRYTELWRYFHKVHWLIKM